MRETVWAASVSLLLAACAGDAGKTTPAEKPAAAAETAKPDTVKALQPDTAVAVVEAPPKPKPEKFVFDEVRKELNTQEDARSAAAAQWLKKALTGDPERIQTTRVFTQRCLDYLQSGPDDIEEGLMSEKQLKSWKISFAKKWERDFDVNRLPPPYLHIGNGGCMTIKPKNIRFLGSETSGDYFSLGIFCGDEGYTDTDHHKVIVRVIEKDGGYRIDNIMGND